MAFNCKNRWRTLLQAAKASASKTIEVASPAPLILDPPPQNPVETSVMKSPDTANPYPNLFTPLKLGVERTKLVLPHRLIMAPTYMNWEVETKLESRAYWERMASFYEARVRGGCYLVTSGVTAPSLLGRFRRGALSLTTPDTAKMYRRVTDRVHEAGGKMLLQLVHAGRSGMQPIGLSSSSEGPEYGQPYSYMGLFPTQAPTWAMNYLVQEYERGCKFAIQAGFDGIEISAADGSFLHNFVCAEHNRRKDKYGGEVESRVKILMEVLGVLQYAIPKGSDFIVSCRLSVHDMLPGGNAMWETKIVAETVAKSGLVDLITTSVGMKDSTVGFMSSHVPKAMFARCVKIVRDHLIQQGCHIPISASHRIPDPKTAEALLEQGVCDLVSLSRPLLADPQWVANAKANVAHRTMPCIYCNHCLDHLYYTKSEATRVSCAINPLAGWEAERVIVPTEHPKRIIIVGAGPTGITCALTASRRGHTVVLYEMSNEIGGQLNLAKLIPGKEGYWDLLEFWTKELRDSNVIVKMNSEYSEMEIKGGHQHVDAVVLCMGSLPQPRSGTNWIPGSDGLNVVGYEEVIKGKIKLGNKVGIIGSGPMAWDTASFLLHDHQVCKSPSLYAKEHGVDLLNGITDVTPTGFRRNNREVTIFGRADRLPCLQQTVGWTQKKWTKQHGLDYIPGCQFSMIRENGLHFFTRYPVAFGSIYQPVALFPKFFHECDSLIWCMGMCGNARFNSWIHEWITEGARQRGEVGADFQFHYAGSCRTGKVGEGHGEQDLTRYIQEGFEVGCKI